MKTNSPLLTLLILMFALSACTIDSYETGEGDYSTLQAEMVEAHANSQKQIDYADADNGERLNLSQPLSKDWVTTGDTFYRGLLYYKKNGATVDVVSLQQISEIGIQSTDSLKKRHIEIKTDPLSLEGIWVSKNKRYLNASIHLKIGTTTDTNAIHHIGMVADSIHVNGNGDKTLCLRLTHDQGGMPEHYTVTTLFSLPLKDVGNIVDSIRIDINTYDGMTTKCLSVK